MSTVCVCPAGHAYDGEEGGCQVCAESKTHKCPECGKDCNDIEIQIGCPHKCVNCGSNTSILAFARIGDGRLFCWQCYQTLKPRAATFAVVVRAVPLGGVSMAEGHPPRCRGRG